MNDQQKPRRFDVMGEHIRQLRAIEVKGATVTLTEVEYRGTMTYVSRYEVATTTGYRATLPACPCERTPCLGCRESSVSHCHYGTHELQAQALAAEVAKTYGSAARGRSRVPARRASVGPGMTEREWAAARGEIGWDEV